MRGSIVKNKRKGGITYSAVADYPTEKGKRRQVKKTFASKKEAEDELIRMLAEAQAQEDGGYVDIGKVTVGEYLDRYLEAVAPGLEAGTLDNKKTSLLHWRKLIGSVPLAKLTRLDVQRAANGLPAELAPTTKRSVYAVFRCALRQAVKWDMLPRDPSEGVKSPSSKKDKRGLHAWTEEETARFLEQTKAGTRLHPLFALALATGMRQGELLGLKWQDVDLVKGTVSVCRALVRIRGQKSVLRPPKTTGSRRQIPLDTATTTLLKAHRKRQMEERLAIGPKWEDNGLVFCTRQGTPLHNTQVELSMHTWSAKAGVPRIRFHDLRHTHATLLLKAWVQVKVVSERLGHSTIRTTLDIYAHVLPDMQKEAVEAMERIFNRPRALLPSVTAREGRGQGSQ